MLRDDGRHKHVIFHGMSDASEVPLWHVFYFLNLPLVQGSRGELKFMLI